MPLCYNKLNLVLTLLTKLIQKIEDTELSIDNGLRYCGGDKDFYIDLLKDYMEAYEEKAQQLELLLYLNRQEVLRRRLARKIVIILKRIMRNF